MYIKCNIQLPHASTGVLKRTLQRVIEEQKNIIEKDENLTFAEENAIKAYITDLQLLLAEIEIAEAQAMKRPENIVTTSF